MNQTSNNSKLRANGTTVVKKNGQPVNVGKKLTGRMGQHQFGNGLNYYNGKHQTQQVYVEEVYPVEVSQP